MNCPKLCGNCAFPWKLCVSTKFPQQELRLKVGILCSTKSTLMQSFVVFQFLQNAGVKGHSYLILRSV